MNKKDLIEKAKKLGITLDPSMTKTEMEEFLKEKTVVVQEKVESDIKGEFQTKEVEVAKPTNLTFLGMGGLSGEYRFAEIPGSIVASSMEEAIKKAGEYLAQTKALQK